MRKGDLAAIIDLNEKDDQIQPLTAARPIGTLPFAGRYRLIDFPLSSLDHANVRSVAIFSPSRVAVSRIISAAAQPGIWIR